MILVPSPATKLLKHAFEIFLGSETSLPLNVKILKEIIFSMVL